VVLILFRRLLVISIGGTISIPGVALSGSITFAGPMIVNGVLSDVEGTMEIAPSLVTPVELPARNNQPVIPKMTGPTTDGFTATATTEYNGVAKAFHARSENPITDQWANLASSQAQIVPGGPEHVHTFMFPGAFVLYSTSIQLRSDDNANAPRTWLREVYNGTSWIAAGSFSKNDWTNGQKLTDDLQTPGFYSGWRLRVTSSGPLCQFADLQAYS
jgi:hypothetical protein